MNILIYTAVPFQDETSGSDGRNSFTSQVIYQVLEQICNLPTPPPPNSPTSNTAAFTFPVHSQEVSARLQNNKPSRRVSAAVRRRGKLESAGFDKPVPVLEDSNDADESDLEEGAGGERRKRGRVSSFSGSAPHLRRVPHKKKRPEVVVVAADEDTDNDVKDKEVSPAPPADAVDGSDSLAEATVAAPWRRLGVEMRTIAAKFATGPTTTALAVKKPRRRSSKMTACNNVMSLAVNLVVYGFMKRLVNKYFK